MKNKNPIEIENHILVNLKWINEEYKIAEASIRITGDKLLYEVIESPLDKEEKDIYLKVLMDISKIDTERNLARYSKKAAFDFIARKIREIAKEKMKHITKHEEAKITYYVYKNYVGFGAIEPLLYDKNVKYIFCEKPGMPVYIFHKNPNYGFMKTNLRFKNNREYKNATNNIIIKSRAIREPPEYIGVFNNKLVEISGIYGDIQINEIEKLPLSPNDIVKLGIASSSEVRYLYNAIQKKASILIIGSTNSKRTEVLNALALMTRKDEKTVIFERFPNTTVSKTDFYTKVLPLYKNPQSIIKKFIKKKPQLIIANDIKEEYLKPIINNIKNKCQTFISLDAVNLDSAMKKLSKYVPAPLISFIDIIIVVGEGKDGWPEISNIYEISEFDFNLGKLKITPIFYKINGKLFGRKSKLFSE
jgi:flagellar protein FlaI